MAASRLQTPENTQLEYELTWCEIDRERDTWIELRQRVARTSGLDAILNAHYDMVNNRMNGLLEELFSKMGQLAALGVESGSAAAA